MSTAEITAYLWGAHEAEGAHRVLQGEITDDEWYAQPINLDTASSLRTLGEATFAYWMLRGSNDWANDHLKGV